MSTTPGLSIREFQAAQAQPELVINPAIRTLEIFCQLRVLDKDLSIPPSAPADGDAYLVAAGATGAWAGNDTSIASWQQTAWAFFAAKDGYRAWVADEAAFYLFSDAGSPSGWSLDAGGGGGGGGSSAPSFADSVSATPAATVDDYAPAGWSSAKNRLLLTAFSGGTTVNGLLATGFSDGDTVLISAEGIADGLTFPHEAFSSSAANRFACAGLQDLFIPQGGLVLAVRIDTRWRLK